MNYQDYINELHYGVVPKLGHRGKAKLYDEHISYLLAEIKKLRTEISNHVEVVVNEEQYKRLYHALHSAGWHHSGAYAGVGED